MSFRFVTFSVFTFFFITLVGATAVAFLRPKSKHSKIDVVKLQNMRKKNFTST